MISLLLINAIGKTWISWLSYFTFFIQYIKCLIHTFYSIHFNINLMDYEDGLCYPICLFGKFLSDISCSISSSSYIQFQFIDTLIIISEQSINTVYYSIFSAFDSVIYSVIVNVKGIAIIMLHELYWPRWNGVFLLLIVTSRSTISWIM